MPRRAVEKGGGHEYMATHSRVTETRQLRTGPLHMIIRSMSSKMKRRVWSNKRQLNKEHTSFMDE